MNKILFVLSFFVVVFVHCGQVFAQEEVVCHSVENLSVATVAADRVLVQWYGLEDALGFEAITDSAGKIPEDCGTRYTTSNFEQNFYNLIPNEMNQFLVRSLCYGTESDWRWLFLRYTNTVESLPFSTSFTQNSITDSISYICSQDTNTFAYYYMDIEVGDTSVGNYIDFSFRQKVFSDTNKVSIFVLSPNSSISIDNLPGEIHLLGAFGQGDTTWQRIHLELGTNISGSVQRILFAWENNDGETLTPPVLIDSIDIASRYCAVPDSVRASEISSTSAMISWDFAFRQERFTLQYRPTGSDTWTELADIENNCLLYNLTPDSFYDVRVKALCLYEESLFSEIYTFKTAIDLAVPENIAYTSTDSSAYISWQEVENATHYIVNWKTNDDISNWNVQTVEENHVLLTNLDENTEYVFKLGSANGGIASLWSDIYTLRTNCAKNTSYPYTISSAIIVSNTEEDCSIPQCWKINSQYITSQSFDLTQLSSGELSFAYNSPIYFSLEISIDGGENFTSFASLPPSTSSSTNIYSLSSFIYYDDVVFRFVINSNSFYDNNNEVSINNLRIENGCPLPSDIIIGNLEENSFDLHWSDTGSVNQWAISLKDNQGNVILSANISDTTYTFSNLVPNNEYTVVIHSICEGSLSTDSLEISVTTTAFEESCTVPQNFSAVWWHSDNGETLYATWDAEEHVNIWQVVYKDYYALAWDTALVTINPVFTLRNMELNHVFLIKARAICNIGDTSDFTQELSVRIGENALEDNISKDDDIILYPNPAKDKVYISTQNKDINRVVILNSLGETVQEYHKVQEYMDLSSYSKGLYYAVFFTKSNQKITKKIILE